MPFVMLGYLKLLLDCDGFCEGLNFVQEFFPLFKWLWFGGTFVYVVTPEK